MHLQDSLRRQQAVALKKGACLCPEGPFALTATHPAARPTVQDAVRWAHQVAEGLAYLHQLNPMVRLGGVCALGARWLCMGANVRVVPVATISSAPT